MLKYTHIDIGACMHTQNDTYLRIACDTLFSSPCAPSKCSAPFATGDLLPPICSLSPGDLRPPCTIKLLLTDTCCTSRTLDEPITFCTCLIFPSPLLLMISSLFFFSSSSSLIAPSLFMSISVRLIRSCRAFSKAAARRVTVRDTQSQRHALRLNTVRDLH